MLNKGPLIKEISQTNDLVLICVKFWPKWTTRNPKWPKNDPNYPHNNTKMNRWCWNVMEQLQYSIVKDFLVVWKFRSSYRHICWFNFGGPETITVTWEWVQNENPIEINWIYGNMFRENKNQEYKMVSSITILGSSFEDFQVKMIPIFFEK